MAIHLVISDIHRDYHSFSQLLDKYAGQFDDIWFLGDIAGHGEHLNGNANMIRCFQALHEHNNNKNSINIKGNWEMWICKNDQSKINPNISSSFSISQIRAEIYEQGLLDWISDWHWKKKEGDFTLTHGWVETNFYQRDSKPWETYLYPEYTGSVSGAFIGDRIKSRHVIVGHTHIPGFFRFSGATTRWIDLNLPLINIENSYDVDGLRFVFNPGSISGARNNSELRTALFINTDSKTYRFISI